MNKLLYFIYFVVILGVFPLNQVHAAGILGVHVVKNTAVITLNLKNTSPYKVFIVSDPERLVIDVPNVSSQPRVSLPKSYQGRLIRDVRFGQFSPNTHRFVFDLTLPIDIVGVSHYRSKGQIKVVITPAAKGKTTKRKSSYQSGSLHVPSKPKKKRKPLIIIDPGHGGVDPGAIGPRKVYEKDIVLKYAKMLKAELLKTGKYRVGLTRTNDRFIRLRDRVKYARDKKADLFISLHADSAPERSARGLSVYTLSEKASDQEAAALAARENKADILAGIDLSTEREDVADILISLAQRDTTNRSSQLADLLVYSLDKKIRLLSNAHRFAGFAVLKAPDVASVLIELGFISHPQEEKLLRSYSHRQKVVQGLVKGIGAYFAQCVKAE